MEGNIERWIFEELDLDDPFEPGLKITLWCNGIHTENTSDPSAKKRKTMSVYLPLTVHPRQQIMWIRYPIELKLEDKISLKFDVKLSKAGAPFSYTIDRTRDGSGWWITPK